MNDKMQVFSYERNEVRTIQRNGETWWVLKDVCAVLDIANSRDAAIRLDEDEKDDVGITDAIGRVQNTTVINESGLYNVILISRKPEAKKFKRWVTHEVLPTIRKHGAYVTPAKLEEIMNDPDAWIKVLTALKDERAAKEQLQLEITRNEPKVAFADAVATSETSIFVGELAKILKQNGVRTGQNRLFDWLRNNNYLISRYGTDYNMPTQYSMELDLFEIKETPIIHPQGYVTISKTPKVTSHGQLYFVNKLRPREKSIIEA